MKKDIIDHIREKVRDANANGVVIGLSGGLDSTTTLFLCVETLGDDRVLGVIMPSKTNKKEDTDDAIQICDKLRVKYRVIEIDPIVESFGKFLDLSDKLVKGNLMARIRMCILYYFANKERFLVVGTGNKSEYLLGYFTLHGDSAGDLMPLINLYKTEVKQLASEIGVPRKILDKIPSAGLWIGQTDEEELGLTYDKLDKILPFLEKKISLDEIQKKTGIKRDDVEKVERRIKKTEFKRKYPK